MSEVPDVADVLARALSQVKIHRTQFNKIIEAPQGRLLLAIQAASTMLEELRTSALPPQPYYELYNACFDALSQFEDYLISDHRFHNLNDVYQIAQYTSNVLPRLYLMITVGVALIGTEDAPYQDVLKDMLDMSRGIQNPLRGLFLRYYLGQRTAMYLRTNTPADVHFCVRFTLSNFVEMNKLWIRYQQDGLLQEAAQRLEGRRQLRTIVGSSILRLSSLEPLDLKYFSREVLPPLMTQIIQCRDKLAQEYLLDVIIQAFPAEYHLETLTYLLGKLRYLVPETSLALVLKSSMERLTVYAKQLMQQEREKLEAEAKAKETKAEETKAEETKAEVAEEAQEEKEVEKKEKAEEDEEAEDASENKEDEKVEAEEEADDKEASETEGEPPAESEAEKAEEASEKEAEEAESDQETEETTDSKEEEVSSDLPDGKSDAGDLPDGGPGRSETSATATIHSVVASYWQTVAQLNVSAAERAAMVGGIVALADVAAVPVSIDDMFAYITRSPLSAHSEIEGLLKTLFDVRSVDISAILRLLRAYPALLASQSSETRRTVAEFVVARLLDAESSAGSASAARIDADSAEQILELMSVLLSSGGLEIMQLRHFILLMRTDDVARTLELLHTMHRRLRKLDAAVVAGASGMLVLHALELLRDAPSPSSATRVLKFCSQVSRDMATIGKSPLYAFRLYVTCGTAADEIGAEDAAYDMFVEALSVYEEYITSSAHQAMALSICVAALQKTSVFTSENFDPLAQRCLQYGQRLIRKQDQCRLLLKGAHLYWDNSYADARRVEEVLSRALRSADSVIDIAVSIELFLDVLDTNLYFLGNDVSTVTASSVNGVLALARDTLANALKEESDDTNHQALAALQRRWERTLRFVRAQADAFPRFQDLTIEE